MRGSGSRRSFCLSPLSVQIWAPAKAFCSGVGRGFDSLMVWPSSRVGGGDGIWWIRVCGLFLPLCAFVSLVLFNSLLGLSLCALIVGFLGAVMELALYSVFCGLVS
ncbi:unnamed protein product [Arabidopsis lyrata]|nr:unnamed protein product [Arabidopsis lyrata]